MIVSSSINHQPIINDQSITNSQSIAKNVGFALARRDSVLDQKREQGGKKVTDII
jgi:hypothetical protein